MMPVEAADETLVTSKLPVRNPPESCAVRQNAVGATPIFGG